MAAPSAFPYLILGGGVAGIAAVDKLVRLKQGDRVGLLSAEAELPYDRPPLSKEFLRGQMEEPKLRYHDRGYYDRHGVTLLLGRRVTGIDPRGKTVSADGGPPIGYGKLLIALGARPRRLEAPGGGLGGVFYLRALDDSRAIRAAMAEARRAVVVGAGFIGMEVAAALAERGIAVTVLDVADRLWPRVLDRRVAAIFEAHYRGRGVEFAFGDAVAAFEGAGGVVRAVRTTSGQTFPGDLAVVGIGTELPLEVVPEGAGIELDRGIVVDRQMRTGHPDIFAAGDLAVYTDPVFGRRRRVEHWGHAQYGGGLAAQNMAGQPAEYELLTYFWSDTFDLHIESAGDETEYEAIALRGDTEARRFTACYLRGGRLVAYFQVNGEQPERDALERLIRAGRPITPAQLEDEGVDLAALAG